jgi:hypothetical protein
MILNVTPQDSDANNTSGYFDTLRQKNYEASFDGVKNFITENKDRLRQSRRKKPLRKWQWALAVLFPVLTILACTKTEHAEPVGSAVSFSVPEGDPVKQELESLVGGLQTVISSEQQKPGYLSYTCFIPSKNSQSADAVISQLKGVKGITGLSAVPVTAKVRESLLSRLGYKIFSTHIDARGLSNEELQNAVNRQLKEKGFNHISVTVTGNKRLQLHPTEDAPNYLIEMSIDDNGTKMVLEEEKRTLTDRSKSGDGPKMDFGSMSDAQVRDYIRSQYGKQLPDENIKITRTAGEIGIDVKLSDENTEIMRFKLN